MTPWAALGMVPLPKTVTGRIFAYPPDRSVKVGYKPSITERVKRVLSDGPASVTEISQELGIRAKQVTDCLSKLQKQGLVVLYEQRKRPLGGPPISIYQLVESSDAQTD